MAIKISENSEHKKVQNTDYLRKYLAVLISWNETCNIWLSFFILRLKRFAIQKRYG